MTKNLLPIRLQIFTIFFVVFSFISTLSAQEWKDYLPEDKVENGTLSLWDYQKAFNQYWDAYDVVDGYYKLNGEKQKAYFENAKEKLLMSLLISGICPSHPYY